MCMKEVGCKVESKVDKIGKNQECSCTSNLSNVLSESYEEMEGSVEDAQDVDTSCDQPVKYKEQGSWIVSYNVIERDSCEEIEKEVRNGQDPRKS